MDTGVRWDHPEFLKPGITSVPDPTACEDYTRVRDILIHGASEYNINWASEGLVAPGTSTLANYKVQSALMMDKEEISKAYEIKTQILGPDAADEKQVANGLPVFEVFYENDDDPTRRAGKNSRLLFKAPDNAAYTVRVADTRGEGGDNFGYKLAIRPARPAFKPSLAKPNAEIRKGAGREVIVRVDRVDGFDGPVTFELNGLPEGLVSSFPVTIQSGQRYALASIWAAESTKPWKGDVSPKVVASAKILGEIVVQEAGDLGVLKLGEQPRIVPSIQPIDGSVGVSENWTLKVRRGHSVSARVVVRRKEGFQGQVSFGKENAGRNAPHGVYVDNIGLNGLLVRQGENERVFVLTADPIAELGKRSFFLRGEVDGKVTTHPITVEVLP